MFQTTRKESRKNNIQVLNSFAQNAGFLQIFENNNNLKQSDSINV